MALVRHTFAIRESNPFSSPLLRLLGLDRSHYYTIRSYYRDAPRRERRRDDNDDSDDSDDEKDRDLLVHAGRTIVAKDLKDPPTPLSNKDEWDKRYQAQKDAERKHAAEQALRQKAQDLEDKCRDASKQLDRAERRAQDLLAREHGNNTWIKIACAVVVMALVILGLIYWATSRGGGGASYSPYYVQPQGYPMENVAAAAPVGPGSYAMERIFEPAVPRGKVERYFVRQ